MGMLGKFARLLVGLFMLGGIFHTYPFLTLRLLFGEDYLRFQEGSFGGRQNFLLYSKMRDHRIASQL